MTNEESIILANTLILSNRVINNDLDIEDAVNSINAVTTDTQDYNTILEESINSMVEKTSALNKAVMIKIINTLTVLEPVKEVKLGVLEARTLDVSNTVKVIAFIDNALTNGVDNFMYYSLVAKIAIMLGDSVRIKSAITKIESLGV